MEFLSQLHPLGVKLWYASYLGLRDGCFVKATFCEISGEATKVWKEDGNAIMAAADILPDLLERDGSFVVATFSKITGAASDL